MQALAKLSAFPTFFKRACGSVAPVLRSVAPRRRSDGDDRAWSAGADVGDSRFRVTDRRRRWTKVRHFADLDAALRHADAHQGVVWERYVGPTGAANWWSLTDEECEALRSGPPPCGPAV